MLDKPLEGFRVAILATNGFEEAELLEPRQALDAAGAITTLVSPNSGKVQGMNHSEKGQVLDVDKTFNEVRPSDFDAALLPGGVVNADTLRVVAEAQRFVKALDTEGKPLAVICHGSWLLVSAGLVTGRHLTSYHTLIDDLRNAGARWSDEEVLRDRNWVSSRKPADLPAFNKEMIRLFYEYSSARHAKPKAAGGR